MVYKLRADVVEDEHGKRIAYGIDVFQLIRSVPCVFTDEQRALAFLELCNVGQPCDDHLTDLLDDLKKETAHL